MIDEDLPVERVDNDPRLPRLVATNWLEAATLGLNMGSATVSAEV
jgi:hypothetical protein